MQFKDTYYKNRLNDSSIYEIGKIKLRIRTKNTLIKKLEKLFELKGNLFVYLMPCNLRVERVHWEISL